MYAFVYWHHKRRSPEDRGRADQLMEWNISRLCDPAVCLEKHWTALPYPEEPELGCPKQGENGSCECVERFRGRMVAFVDKEWPKRLAGAMRAMETFEKTGAPCPVLMAALGAELTEVARQVSDRREEWCGDVKEWLKSRAATHSSPGSENDGAASQGHPNERIDSHVTEFIAQKAVSSGEHSNVKSANDALSKGAGNVYMEVEKAMAALRAEGLLRFANVKAVSSAWDAWRGGNPASDFLLHHAVNLQQTQSGGNVSIIPQEPREP